MNIKNLQMSLDVEFGGSKQPIRVGMGVEFEEGLANYNYFDDKFREALEKTMEAVKLKILEALFDD